MRHTNCIWSLVATCVVVTAIFAKASGDDVELAAIAAHQDQLQNLVLDCKETRTYDIDPAVAAQSPSHYMQGQIDLKRTELFNLRFEFLGGDAFYDRTMDPSTIKYWAAKGLPAIIRKVQTISTTGKTEELTTQRVANGSQVSFGGVRQLAAFSPDDTIDIALGLRVLEGRHYLTKSDLANLSEVKQTDPGAIVLRASDGGGHVHELHFDRRLLYALTYYRCTNSHGAYLEITNSEFRRFGNVFIPGKIVRSSNALDSTGQIRHPLVFTIQVENASVNDVDNTLARYSISWPAKMRLFDQRTNDRIDVGPTTRPLTDDDIRQQLAERRMHQVLIDGITKQRMQKLLEDAPTTRP